LFRKGTMPGNTLVSTRTFVGLDRTATPTRAGRWPVRSNSPYRGPPHVTAGVVPGLDKLFGVGVTDDSHPIVGWVEQAVAGAPPRLTAAFAPPLRGQPARDAAAVAAAYWVICARKKC
jgi:hypothetical protein